MSLINGDTPNPSEMINYYLKDGDEIYITLGYSQPIELKSGKPAKSEWGTLAFVSADNIEKIKTETVPESSNSDDEFELEDNLSPEERVIKKKNMIDDIISKAKFMKLVLESQMLNYNEITMYITHEWNKVSSDIPKLSIDEEPIIRKVFIDNGEYLKALFKNYAPDGVLSQDHFKSFLEDTDVFPANVLNIAAPNIYDRVLKCVKGTQFHFRCILVALIFCAQTKYNDTLNAKNTKKKSYDALSDLISNHCRPLAKELQLKCTLKEEFCKDEMLAKIRVHYNELHLLFDKTAAKARDIPSTVPIMDVHDILYQANLTDEKQSTSKLAKQLYDEVRFNGSIYGREVSLSADKDDHLLDNEFTFPEFLEALAYAGVYRFYKKEEKPNSAGEVQDSKLTKTMAGCMLKGVTNVVESIANPNAHRKVTDKNKSSNSKGKSKK